MKKMFFLIAIMIFATFYSYGQHKNKKYHITVDGFEGNKPLKQNSDVCVYFTEDHEDGYPFPAYKGETEKSFLLRLRSDSIKNAKEDSENKASVYKPKYWKMDFSNKNTVKTKIKLDSSFKPTFQKGPDFSNSKEKKEPGPIATMIIVAGLLVLIVVLSGHLKERPKE